VNINITAWWTDGSLHQRDDGPCFKCYLIMMCTRIVTSTSPSLNYCFNVSDKKGRGRDAVQWRS